MGFALEYVQKAIQPTTISIDEAHTLEVYQGDAARMLVDFLNRSTQDKSWDGQQWVLKYPLTCEPANLPFPLPPNPKDDIFLNTILEALGWKMTVTETDQHLVVRLDFGEGGI